MPWHKTRNGSIGHYYTDPAKSERVWCHQPKPKPTPEPVGEGYTDLGPGGGNRPGRVIEGEGRAADSTTQVLPGTASTPPETESASAGADTPAEAAPPSQEPTGTPPPSSGLSPQPEGAPAATEAAKRPTLKPSLDPTPLANVKRNEPLKTALKTALQDAGVTARQVQDFSYNLQLGVEAVLQLAADGYKTEQVVQIVKGEAVPLLGW